MTASTIPASASTQTGIPVQIRKLIDLAKTIQKITTPEQRQQVGQIHAKLATERRDSEELMREVLAPILKRERETRAPFKLVIETCQLWERQCEQSMAAYDRDVLRLARLKQEEENRKVEAANQKAIEKAEETGTAPILKAPTVVETAAKTVKAEDGASSSRREVTKWKFEGQGPDESPDKLIGNDPRLAKLSKEFMVVNMSRINKAVAMGGNEEALKAQGILVYKDFDYTGRSGR